MTGAAAPRLDAVLARLRPRLGAPRTAPTPLDGGITNRNYRVRFAQGDCVVRLPGRGTELLGIDRDAERAAASAAARAGVAPDVVAFDDDERCLVTRFATGRALAAGELARSGALARVAEALRVVHGGPSFPGRFDPWRLVETYRVAARERGGAVCTDYAAASREAGRIAPLLRGPEHAPVPCHNDLLPANLLLDGARVWILDWEYAGMGDRYFDLANLSVNNELSENDDRELLAAYFGEPCPRWRFARLRLMRLMSDFREAMWGVLQASVCELDFDFTGYAAEHFARMSAAAADPRYADWLRDAAEAPS